MNGKLGAKTAIAVERPSTQLIESERKSTQMAAVAQTRRTEPANHMKSEPAGA